MYIQPYLYNMFPCDRAKQSGITPSTMNMPMPIPSTMPSTTMNQPLNMAPPSNFEQAPGSPTELGIEYTQGYLRTLIGRRVRVTFLLGTNTIQDRDGDLKQVGISYIVLTDPETGNDIMCDIYSIKFVNVIANPR